MKIPIIKHLVNFVEANDEDYIHETIEVLESLADVPTLKDEELEVIGELISNLYGSIEVNKEITNGTPKNITAQNAKYKTPKIIISVLPPCRKRAFQLRLASPLRW